MSHFTVAVITQYEDVEDALAPFHEYECTGVKDEYVKPYSGMEHLIEQYNTYDMCVMKNTIVNPLLQGEEPYASCEDPRFIRDLQPHELKIVDGRKFSFNQDGLEFILNYWDGNTEQSFKVRDHQMFMQWRKISIKCNEFLSMLEFVHWLHGKDIPVIKSGETPDDEWHNWVEIDENGVVVDYFYHTNENAKWDWYVVGGRWSNMLLTKDGDNVDSCTIGDLDFEAERKKLEDRANGVYDSFEKCLGTLERNWKQWKEVLNDPQFKTIEERRDFYNNQAQLKQIRENDKEGIFGVFGYNLDDFLTSREEFVKANSNNPFGTYALLDATEDGIGKWYGSEMGYWGMSIREEEDWNTKNQKLLASFPDDYYITIVDCHI